MIQSLTRVCQLRLKPALKVELERMGPDSPYSLLLCTPCVRLEELKRSALELAL